MLFLFTCVKLLLIISTCWISVTSQSNDESESNVNDCSTVNCAPDTVCQIVKGQAECVDQPSDNSFCLLPAETGRCRASIPSWYFDVKTSKCDEFIYGGCKGNANRFPTKEQCERFCGSYVKSSKGGACDQNPCKECEFCMDFSLICPMPPCPSFACLKNETCEKQLPKPGGSKIVPHDLQWKTITIVTEEVHATFRPDSEIKRQRVCRMNSETGRCRGYFKRWFYNSNKQICEEFVYGGCSGNENNFETKDICENRCEGIKPCPVYDMMKPPEGCTVAMPMQPDGCPEMQLNCTEGPCAQNQCDPNCEYCVNERQQCVGDPCPQYRCQKKKFCSSFEKPIDEAVNSFCQLSADTGPCRAAYTRWFFNSTSGTCETFTYGGCKGNDNRFFTKEICSDTCTKSAATKLDDPEDKQRMCHLPAIIGPCNSFSSRWFYDNGICKEFDYGGCEGNANNFQSEEQCKTKCSGVEACPPMIIPQPVLEGCVLIPQTKKNGCQSLTVSCPGRDPCLSKPCRGECETCVKEDVRCKTAPCPQYRCEKNNSCVNHVKIDDGKSNERCSLPREIGTCRAALKRWFFNNTNEECEEFLYGGCRGNENRFETLSDCLENCQTTIKEVIVNPVLKTSVDFDKYHVCRQEALSGDCNEELLKWFFANGQCRQFNYTGCNGNDNNFNSESECLQVCNGVKPCPVYDAPEPIAGCEIATYFTADHCPRFHYKCTKGACGTRPCSSDCENCVNEPPKACIGQNCQRYYCERNETCVTEGCAKLQCSAGFSCDILNKSPTCVRRSLEQMCNGNIAVGSCLGQYNMFHYDIGTGSCRPFVYTGCDGNSNRFETLEQCEKTCIQ